MASRKFPQFPPATSLTGQDLLLIWQSGENKRIVASQLKTFIDTLTTAGIGLSVDANGNIQLGDGTNVIFNIGRGVGDAADYSISKQNLDYVTKLMLDNGLANYQLSSEKGQPNGYASLDGGGKVPANQLPSYVDDVLEFANLAAFPATGETGKIYVALDTNKTYRWSGSAYIEISASDVNSVFGRTGVVTAQSGDYSAFYVTLDTLQTVTGQKIFNNLRIDSSNGIIYTQQGGHGIPQVGNTMTTAIANDYRFIFGLGAGDYKSFSFSSALLSNNVNRAISIPDASGTLALTSDLAAYLPLSGGTLTGALNGTSASFTGNGIIGGSLKWGQPTGGQVQYMYRGDDGIFANQSTTSNSLYSGSNFFSIRNSSDTSALLTVLNTGAATFSSSVTASSFSVGNGTLSNSGFWGTLITAGTGSFANFGLINSATDAIMYNLSGTLNMIFTGNVGIGTTAPASLLTINGTSANTESGQIRIIKTGANEQTLQIGYNTTSDYAYLNSYKAGIGYKPIALNPDGGNVGIGTTAPGQKLSVAGDISAQASTVFADKFENWGSTLVINSGGGLPTVFQTNGTERLRITSTGNVGIGTTAPTRRLHVEQAASAFTEVARFSNTSNNASNDFAFVSILGANAANTNSYHYIALTGGADQLYIYGNGNVVNTNNSYGSLSDIKLKENIVDTTPKLDDLMKVKVRNYNLIGDDKKQIGVIAQELEEVFPAMIDESEDFEEKEVIDENGNVTKERINLGTSTKSVKYSVFVPMLIKAIQELKAELDILKQK